MSIAPRGDVDLIEELDRLGYGPLAEVFAQVFPERDPYELIKEVLDMLDQPVRLIRQGIN